MPILSALGLKDTDAEAMDKRRAREAAYTQSGYARDSRARSLEGRSRYLDLLEGFDPREYMAEAAQGVGDRLHEGYTADIARDNASMNARGFYGGVINQPRLARGFADRLSRALSSLSLSAAGLESGRLRQFGDVTGRTRPSRSRTG